VLPTVTYCDFGGEKTSTTNSHEWTPIGNPKAESPEIRKGLMGRKHAQEAQPG
jgi:hypothetical protein